MDITFKVGEMTAAFHRNWFTGRASLSVAGQDFKLQNPWNPATHFGLRLTHTWTVNIPNHGIAIEKTRPRLFAGFRSSAYRVFVDDQVVAETSGY